MKKCVGCGKCMGCVKSCRKYWFLLCEVCGMCEVLQKVLVFAV